MSPLVLWFWKATRSSALLLGKLTPKGLSRLWGFVSVLKGHSGAEERDNTAERMQVSASQPQQFANCPALHRGFIIPHSKLPEEIAFIAATLYVKSEARWTEKQLSVGISRQVTEMKDRISSRISVGSFSTYLSTCDSNCFTMNTDQIFVEQRGFLCSAHC